MPLIAYTDWQPKADAQHIIAIANDILRDYNRQGYDLTLRQLYYQFVARDLLPNTQQSYKRLGSIIQQARDAGLVDWNHITDRGREIHGKPHWADGEDFLRSVAPQFNLDLWDGQPVRVQVWVEKDALSDVVGRAAKRWDCSHFACKGYVSASALWAGAQQMLHSDCDEWVILHLGDHDPSGLDMTRDIRDRLSTYSLPYSEGQTRPKVRVYRIALNMDQVEEYQPPPNPAKTTDSRATAYIQEHGNESWELDALEPSVLVDLIETHIQEHLHDRDRYDDRKARQDDIRDQLAALRLED